MTQQQVQQTPYDVEIATLRQRERDRFDVERLRMLESSQRGYLAALQDNQHRLEAFDEMLAALHKIADHPEGAYNRDKEQYLKNVIAWCQDTARDAIALATDATG